MPPLSLNDFVAKARDMDETRFAAEYPHPFLLSEGGISGADTSVLSQASLGEAPTQSGSRAVA
jgi:hypothetical protein